MNPKTGEIRSKIPLTVEMMQGMMRDCKKSLWLMRNGFYIFMNNNSVFRSGLIRSKPLKSDEVKNGISYIAEMKGFQLTHFSWAKDTRELSISLASRKGIVGEPVKMLLSNGRRWDLVKSVERRLYSHEVFEILRNLVNMLSATPLKSMSVSVFDNRNRRLCIFSYGEESIAKLLEWKSPPEQLPRTAGRLPYGSYEIDHEVRVPHGTRKHFLGLSPQEIRRKLGQVK